jgi:hypothetical protein
MKYLNGYKAMVDHVHSATGITYSTEAMRKIVDRDPVLRGARTWFNGIPRVKSVAMDAWIARAKGVRKQGSWSA